MRPSFHLRITLWFTLSVVGVMVVFTGITYLHLRHELQVEKWERSQADNPDFILHGNYSDAEVNDIAGELLRISFLYSVPVIVTAVFLGRRLSRQSLAPVAAINRQLTGIGIHNLAQRVNPPEADHELMEVARSINNLLDRIETSYREMSAFSGQVAHELKTPLTRMRLQLEDSASQIDPNLADSLQDELRRLEGYVEQCLIMASAEGKKLEIKVERVDLTDLVEDVCEPFAFLAREEQREVELDFRANPVVQAAPWIIRQILHNLLGNALKHGTGNVSVIVDKGPEAVRLLIRNARKRTRSQGTGLGLRIVNGLARQHPGLHFFSGLVDDAFEAVLTLSEPL